MRSSRRPRRTANSRFSCARSRVANGLRRALDPITPVGPYDPHAACTGLALAQGTRAAPVAFWARASAPYLGDPCDIEEDCLVFALIVPLRLAPVRRSRWRAWALAPALAAYRHFGVHAYFDDNAICVSGRRIAACGAQEIGTCALVVSSFLSRPPGALAEWVERDLEGRIPHVH